METGLKYTAEKTPDLKLHPEPLTYTPNIHRHQVVKHQSLSVKYPSLKRNSTRYKAVAELHNVMTGLFFTDYCVYKRHIFADLKKKKNKVLKTLNASAIFKKHTLWSGVNGNSATNQASIQTGLFINQAGDCGLVWGEEVLQTYFLGPLGALIHNDTKQDV